MPDAVVKTTDLTKIFTDFFGRPRVIAVDGLNLTIQRGEVFGLLGPNGSGKTTTLKLLMGFLRPTRGSALMLGKPANDIEKNRKIGFLPEESYFYRFLNARELLDFYARLFGMPRRERKKRVDALLEQVGLSHAAKRRLKEYSMGMLRRAGIAQALINDPDFVIMDEPTSGLDPMGRVDVKNLILELRRRGKTVLLCSHLLGEVENVCSRVGILYRGKLRIEGTFEQLLQSRDALRVSISGADEGAIKKALEGTGGRVTSIAPETESLEGFFMKVIEGKCNGQGVGPGNTDAEGGAAK